MLTKNKKKKNEQKLCLIKIIYKVITPQPTYKKYLKFLLNNYNNNNNNNNKSVLSEYKKKEIYIIKKYFLWYFFL